MPRARSMTRSPRSTSSPGSRACAPSARPDSTSSARARTAVARAVPLVRSAHRDREAARSRAADPRPRRARGGRRDAAAGRRPGAHRVPLLQRRRRARPDLRRQRLVPLLRRHLHVQERGQPARRPRPRARAACCSSSRMRPTSPRCRSAAGRTRRTSSRTPCGRWPNISAPTSRCSPRCHLQHRRGVRHCGMTSRSPSRRARSARHEPARSR